MGRCFVMQPFDDGPFDNRYEQVFAPAITNAGLEPYRVDRDPNVTIPIDEIEAGIRNADVCLAEISLDKPNVWYELGFAIAASGEMNVPETALAYLAAENIPFSIAGQAA